MDEKSPLELAKQYARDAFMNGEKSGLFFATLAQVQATIALVELLSRVIGWDYQKENDVIRTQS